MVRREKPEIGGRTVQVHGPSATCATCETSGKVPSPVGASAASCLKLGQPSRAVVSEAQTRAGTGRLRPVRLWAAFRMEGRNSPSDRCRSRPAGRTRAQAASRALWAGQRTLAESLSCPGGSAVLTAQCGAFWSPWLCFKCSAATTVDSPVPEHAPRCRVFCCEALWGGDL